MTLERTTPMMTVKITPNDKNNPPGKLADAELHFLGATEQRATLIAIRQIATEFAALQTLDHLTLPGFGGPALPLQNENRAPIQSISDQRDALIAQLHSMATTALEQNLDALDGLKLISFGVWERKRERLPDGSGFISGGRNVTFPARQYSVNGERRSFSLLRPIADATAQDRVVDLILKAYAEYEATRDDFAPGSSVTVGTI